MRVAVVGRGRLGGALARAAREAGHDVVSLRRPRAAPAADSPVPESVLDVDTDWRGTDLVLLAFEKRATCVEELEADDALRALRRIPDATPIASVVMSPSPELLRAFLGRGDVIPFLTTPAAALPGAVALLKRPSPDAAPLRRALPALRWVETASPEHERLSVLLVGSAMAVASLGHLGSLLGTPPRAEEAAYLGQVLEDAGRLLALHAGDGFAAFDAVATPGGFTARLHDRIFATPRPGPRAA